MGGDDVGDDLKNELGRQMFTEACYHSDITEGSRKRLNPRLILEPSACVSVGFDLIDLGT